MAEATIFIAEVIFSVLRTGALREEGFAEVEVWPVGEKIAQAAHKAGYAVNDDFRRRAGAVSYRDAAELAQRLMDCLLDTSPLRGARRPYAPARGRHWH